MEELFDYATALKSMSSGRGMFSQEFSHYQDMPHTEQQKVISSFEIKNFIPNSQSFRLLEVYFYEVIGYLGYYIKGEL